MSYSMFRKLGLGELEPTRYCFQFANGSFEGAKGVTWNVIVKVEKCIILTDFMIIDMDKEERVTQEILGRPFLATSEALIDVQREQSRRG